MPRLLITGASGYLGKAVLALFPDWDVHAITRSSLQSTNTPNIHWHHCNLLDEYQMVEVVRGLEAEYLLHLAWETNHSNYWTSRTNYSWLSASLKLLDIFEKSGGQRAVIAGTCAEYEWESDYCKEYKTPLNYSSPYAATKACFSQLAQSFSAQSGLSLAWGRIFFPYGIHENPLKFIPSLIRQLSQGLPFEVLQADNVRDFIYINDVVKIFAQLVTHKYQGIVNVGSGQGISLRDIAFLIADKLDSRDLLTVKHLPEHKTSVVADTSILCHELDWKPQYSLDDGLDASIDWWQSQLETRND